MKENKFNIGDLVYYDQYEFNCMGIVTSFRNNTISQEYCYWIKVFKARLEDNTPYPVPFRLELFEHNLVKLG